ncbi:MAG: restriction endonuclease subunit S [Polyangiales bacterium]
MKFGDVVRLCGDRVDPKAEGIERYVGLEHIEPEDLKIRSWGNVADGTTFTNRFRPGQVLFGKRRAYQRKVAVADFEGVCSGDIYVLEPSSSELLPDLLPFICQSDAFFKRAIETSAGSLSPRTNWTSLAAHEFLLPSKQVQRSLVTLLGDAWDSAIEALRDAMHESDRLTQAMIRELIGSQYCGYHEWPDVALDAVASVERGKFAHRPRNLPRFYGGTYPFVQTGDVAASRGVLERVSQYLSEEGKSYSRSFPVGTVLVTIAAVIGATAITNSEIWCPDSVVGIIPNSSSIDVRFLEFTLRWLRPRLEMLEATKTAQKNINLQVLRPLRIRLPPLHVQRDVVQAIASIDGCASTALQRVRSLQSMRQKFLSSSLEGIGE